MNARCRNRIALASFFIRNVFHAKRPRRSPAGAVHALARARIHSTMSVPATASAAVPAAAVVAAPATVEPDIGPSAPIAIVVRAAIPIAVDPERIVIGGVTAVPGIVVVVVVAGPRRVIARPVITFVAVGSRTRNADSDTN